MEFSQAIDTVGVLRIVTMFQSQGNDITCPEIVLCRLEGRGGNVASSTPRYVHSRELLYTQPRTNAGCPAQRTLLLLILLSL